MDELNSIRSRLSALRRNVATALVLDGAARLAGALLAAIALSFLLDRVFKLETAARAVLLAAALAGLGWTTWRFLVRRIRGVPGEDPLAVAVEARFPDLKDRLISALQLSRVADPERYGMSPQLVQDAVKEAAGPALSIRFGEILAVGRVAKIAVLGLVALMLLGAGAAADPESAGIWFQRNVLLRNVRWPQKTYLEVDPHRFKDGVARIVRGSDFVVTARSVGEEHPDKVTIFFGDSEGDRGQATMKADLQGIHFRHEFTEVAFPIVFRLEGGDEVTRDYRIELMDPPEVEELEILVGFPEYAGREPRTVDLAVGDPEVLRGGYVVAKGRSTKPLEAASLVLGDAGGDEVPALVIGTHGFEVRLDDPKGTVLAGIRLRDTDGLSNPTLSPRFVIRVADDRAPKVRLTKHGIGTMAVSGAVLPWRLRAHDDVKIVEGRLEVLKSAGDRQAPEPHLVPIDAALLGTESAELESELELGPLQLNPGAFLTLYAYAKDNAQPEAHEGKSDPVTVKIVTIEELESDLRRRQQEQRRLFEELIKREERIRDRFLDIRDTPPSAAAELAVRLESQGQDQREIGRRVHAIERAITQILDEMYYNRIADTQRIHELRSKVVNALDDLRTRVMEEHARRLDDAARRADRFNLRGSDGDEVEQGYARVLAAMKAVLAHMVRVEAFMEIVEAVRSIMDAQAEVREATRRKQEDVLREIFGPGGGPDEGK